MGDVVMSRLSARSQRLLAAAVLILAVAAGCRSSRSARVVEDRPLPPKAASAGAPAPAQPAAQTQPSVSSKSAPSAPLAPGMPSAPAEIRTLEVREGAPEVFIDLEASAPLVWTSFRNPEGKVVVELPNAVPSPRVRDVNPEDGLVASVRVQRESEGSRPMTRLVISTRHEVEHAVTADGLHLQVRLLPLESQAKLVASPPSAQPAKPKLAFEPVPPGPASAAGSAGSPAPESQAAPAAPQQETGHPSAAAAAPRAPLAPMTPMAPMAPMAPVAPVAPAAPAAPAAPMAQVAPVAPLPPGTPDQPAVAPPPSGSPATRLEAIEVLAGGAEHRGGTVIRISGDGEFDYATFALSDPSRFVVDLRGVVNRSPRSTVQVESDLVQRVRVAQFRPGPKGVARVVFDLKQSAAPHVERTPQALMVSFGEAPAPGAAAPASPGADTAGTAAVSSAGAPSARSATPAPPTAPSERGTAADPASASSAPPAPTPPTAKSRKGRRAAAAASAPASSPMAPMAPMAPVALVTTGAAAAAPSVAPPASPPSDLALRPAAGAAGTPSAQAVTAQAVRRPAGVGVEVEDAPPARGSKPKSGSGAGLPHVAPSANSLQQPPAELGRKAAGAGEKLGQDVSGEQKAYTGEPIDLKVTNADVTEVLRTFAQISGLNIVVQPGVTGTVTAELENVPWDQAFEEVLKINNLGYEREGNVIRIAPTEVLRREAQERQQLAQARALVIPLRTVMRRLSYARAHEVANLLRSGQSGLLTQRGSVIVDERTNTLIIKELPDFLDAVLAVVSNLDTPEPQVMIEARIIETTKDFSRSLGIQWGFNAVADAAHGNTTGLVFPNNVKAGPQPGVPGNVNLLTGGQNGSLDIKLGNILNTFTLDLQLQAAEHEGLLNILSAPKVATLNNQLAYIQSGIQWPVETIANNTVTTQYINATLRLEVTPQVTAEGTILMDVNISKKEPVTSLIVAGSTNAPINTKDARTKLLVRDGGTAVIGGIYKVTSNVSEDRVPGLANLPIVGHLFKNKSRSENNDELLIFITPRVIKI
jgi:type IV pilus assembly protein PilQ